MKRFIDTVLSASALLVLLPLLLVTGLLVRVSLGRPILLRQLRPGLGGRPFVLYKFRTMRNATDDAGLLLPDEERITPLGRFLRGSSLDELPELWNVVRGDMSLVGPRPLLPEYLPLYSPEQARRHEVRPGISGWAQVSGRNTLSWSDRFRLDVWYVDNRSLMLDLRILVLTIRKVLRRDGISQPGHVTMERFNGSGR